MKTKKAELFSQHVTFTIQPSLWAKVQAEAQAKALQPSSIIRMALAAYLETK